jgi:uncharacterized protein YbjT (DUF2867 family)
MSDLYVVVGASGNTGAIVANGLLDAGKRVRVLGRSASRLQELKERGAELAVGDLTDAAYTEKAFAGAKYAYVMIPPDLTVSVGFRDYQRRVARNQAEAIRKAGLTHVVSLSSVGGDLERGNGPVAGLYELEQLLNAVPRLNVLHLRAGFFMENLLGNVGMIKSMGILGSPARPDLPMTFVAVRDIGQVALEELLRLDLRGSSVRELLGPRNLTMTEVTRAIGEAIGKPDLSYIQFPYADAVKGMVQMGIPEERAQMYAELYRGFNEGTVRPTQPRSPNSTTETTFETFVEKVFTPIWRNA